MPVPDSNDIPPAVESILMLAAGPARTAVTGETNLETLAGVIAHESRKSVVALAEVRIQALKREAEASAKAADPTTTKTKTKRPRKVKADETTAPDEYPTAKAPRKKKAKEHPAMLLAKSMDEVPVSPVDVAEAVKAKLLDRARTRLGDMGEAVAGLLEEPTECDPTTEESPTLDTIPMEEAYANPDSIGGRAVALGRTVASTPASGPTINDTTEHTCTCCGHVGPIGADFGWIKEKGKAPRRQPQCKRCRNEAAKVANAKAKRPARGRKEVVFGKPRSKKPFGRKM